MSTRCVDAARTGAGGGMRARLLLFVALLLAGACAGESDGEPPPTPTSDVSVPLEELERDFDARVGVVAVDLGDDRTVSHRGEERFGFASTLKVFAAAALLDGTDVDERERVVTWTQEDVTAAGYSPVTEGVVETGMPLGELAEAAVRDSDNTAMNLVLEHLGGPAALDEALEQAGDPVTEVVDVEPDLNTVTPGDEADTTTPEAFAGALRAIMVGEWLDDADRELLTEWMTGNATGDTLVRAGAPGEWEVLDKSGGAGAIRNDVAIVLPPDREPIVIAVLTERNDPDADYDDALVASTAEVVLSALS
ncbi:class A beta-lactamase [Aeromicrobium sp. CF4.19]|uniref:class A beta-lactamase n=1 Tax=Aeromicrobium sp. CF4.19 TaxID=3373082 RepID=UPI003EE73E23